MDFPYPISRGGRYPKKGKQQGQAMVYGMFMLLISSLALFALFNTGQLTREKTKLVNTADAVAYSAGLLHARVLNFDAYTNRAMVANEIAIAQLVSVGSWAKYVETEGQTFDMGYPNVGTLASKGLLSFIPSYMAAGYAQTGMSSVQDAAEEAAKASDEIVKNLLSMSQDILHAGLVIARKNLMQQVADANYQDDGTVVVDDVPIQSDLGTAGDLSVGPNAAPFIKKYEKDERTRFAEVVKVSAYKDKFVEKRSWAMVGLWPSCIGWNGIFYDSITRRGGTEMIGFDEWKAMDTLEWKNWFMTKKGACALGTFPIGYGEQPIYKDSDADNFTNFQYYDYSRMVNPVASMIAEMNASEWKFSGLPSFYDLSEKMLQHPERDPRLKFAIRVTRDKSQTRTSDGTSVIKPSGRLDVYHGQPATGKMAALAASEVFFRRPDGDRYNYYGKYIDKPDEIGSLFNPYWQVHLITPSGGNTSTAYSLQGAVAP